jgi:hypothetical protein
MVHWVSFHEPQREGRGSKGTEGRRRSDPEVSRGEMIVSDWNAPKSVDRAEGSIDAFDSSVGSQTTG